MLIRCIFVLSFQTRISVRLNQMSISETDEQRFMHRDEAGSKTRRKTKRKTPEWERRWGQGDGGGHLGVKEESKDDAFGYFLFSAFLPLIGVPPGEVIWMQIRLKRTVSVKKRGEREIEREEERKMNRRKRFLI